jgi:hypothetical protein
MAWGRGWVDRRKGLQTSGYTSVCGTAAHKDSTYTGGSTGEGGATHLYTNMPPLDNLTARQCSDTDTQTGQYDRAMCAPPTAAPSWKRSPQMTGAPGLLQCMQWIKGLADSSRWSTPSMSSLSLLAPDTDGSHRSCVSTAAMGR